MPLTKSTNAILAVAGVALAAGAANGSAEAAMLAALADGKAILWIDTEHRVVTGQVKLDAGASLIGFDVRPADGKLYGVTPDGAIVTIDPQDRQME